MSDTGFAPSTTLPAPIQPIAFSYSSQVVSKPQKAVIRALGLIGGQPKLRRLYLQNER